jgi:hypothetical protein
MNEFILELDNMAFWKINLPLSENALRQMYILRVHKKWGKYDKSKRFLSE